MERLCEEADNWPRGFVLETFRQAFLQLFFSNGSKLFVTQNTRRRCIYHVIAILHRSLSFMSPWTKIGASGFFSRASENLTWTDLVNCQSRWEMRFLNNNFLHHRGAHLGMASKNVLQRSVKQWVKLAAEEIDGNLEHGFMELQWGQTNIAHINCNWSPSGW